MRSRRALLRTGHVGSSTLTLCGGLTYRSRSFHGLVTMKAPRPALDALLIGLSMTLLLAATDAVAQWVWKDESGHVVASDQPPPPGTPPSRIVKEPRARAVAPPPVVDKDAVAKEAKDEAPKSIADRDLDSRQRAKETAEAAKKSDDEAAKARAMQDNCNAVRSNLAALQAGGRAARYNEKGEKVYIDDSQRQAEINRSQGQIGQYCR